MNDNNLLEVCEHEIKTQSNTPMNHNQSGLCGVESRTANLIISFPSYFLIYSTTVMTTGFYKHIVSRLILPAYSTNTSALVHYVSEKTRDWPTFFPFPVDGI